VLSPERTLTSSVVVSGGAWPFVSVKTSRPVPKDKLFDVLSAVKRLRVEAPVSLGQVILSNVAGTGADIVATRTVDRTVDRSPGAKRKG
jgi:CxxC motif-containing protein